MVVILVINNHFCQRTEASQYRTAPRGGVARATTSLKSISLFCIHLYYVAELTTGIR